MDNIWTEGTKDGEQPTSLKERINKLEDFVKYEKEIKETEKEKKEWKFPFRWKRQMNKSTKVRPNENKILVFYLNIKGEMETPILVPLYSGNIIIHKNKGYEFDPRAIWTIKLRRKTIKCVLIKEIDRRPVSNLDWDEVKKRGDATDSDEILLKMVVKAYIEQTKKMPMNKGVIVVIGLLVLGVIIWFFFKK